MSHGVHQNIIAHNIVTIDV